MAQDDVLPSLDRPPAAPGIGQQSIVLHVLCPSLPSPNRFTFNDLSTATSVSDLKTRISQTLPNQPRPEHQRLIYRGKSLANNDAVLRDILEPTDNAEYTMHLALPPVPTPTTSATSQSHPASPNFRPASSQPSATFSTSRSFVYHQHPNAEGLRHRTSHAGNFDSLLQRHFEAVRQQLNSLEAPRGPPPQRQATSVPNEAAQWPQTVPLPSSTRLQQAAAPASAPAPTLSTGANGQAAFADFRGYSPVRLLLANLRQQVEAAENQVHQGVAPQIEQIVRIRTDLYNILDDQCRNPQQPRDGSIEALLARIHNVYTRADQLRLTGSREPVSQAPAPLNTLRAPVYLLSSPSGYQALIAPPGESPTLQTALGSLRTVQTSGLGIPLTRPPADQLPRGADGLNMENVVRQVVIDQRAEENGQLGVVRNVRRLWLFIRLYFVCYMFSEPNTWWRILLVGLAALVSVLSETTVPQHLYGLFVAPIQRHLEGLVHLPTEEEPQPGPAPRDEVATHAQGPQPRTDDQAPAAAGGRAAAGIRERQLLQPGWRLNLRRVERSLALFLASLVPGVGERHVEVQNAADRARQAAIERRRQQEEAERNENAEDRPAVDESSPRETSIENNQDSTDSANHNEERQHAG